MFSYVCVDYDKIKCCDTTADDGDQNDDNDNCKQFCIISMYATSIAIIDLTGHWSSNKNKIL